MTVYIPKIWAIVPAAGKGRRMEDIAVAKQYLRINGKTILQHTLEKLSTEKRISTIVVGVDDEKIYQNCLTAGFVTNAIKPVLGGETRTQTVVNALSYIKKDAHENDWVLIHDAARPCVDVAYLSQFVDKVLATNISAIAGYSVTDTIKKASKTCSSVLIERTLNRDVLWAAQTPQMFRLKALWQALQKVQKENIAITDEASALEIIGVPVNVITCSKFNVKITTSDDLAFAVHYLQKNTLAESKTDEKIPSAN